MLQNESGDFESPYAENPVNTMALTTVMVLLCLVGFFGNITSTIIFLTPSMQSPINVLLAGLTVVDLFVLVLAIPVSILPNILKFQPSRLIETFYPYVILYLYPLNMMSQTCSVWIFILINFERYLAICHPLTMRNYLTTRRTKISLCAAVLMSAAYNVVRFWEFEFSDTDGIKPRLIADLNYYVIFHTTLYLLTQFVAPFVIVSGLNLLVFREMMRTRKTREVMTRRSGGEQNTTNMIIAVTFMFGACNTLPFVLNLWEALEEEVFFERPIVLLLTDVSNALVLLHASTTFLLYFTFCRKYRHTFLVLFKIVRSQDSELSSYSSPRVLGLKRSKELMHICQQNSTYLYGSTRNSFV